MTTPKITPEQRAAMAPIIPEAHRVRNTALAVGLDPVAALAWHFDMPPEHAEVANRLLATNQL